MRRIFQRFSDSRGNLFSINLVKKKKLNVGELRLHRVTDAPRAACSNAYFAKNAEGDPATMTPRDSRQFVAGAMRRLFRMTSRSRLRRRPVTWFWLKSTDWHFIKMSNFYFRADESGNVDIGFGKKNNWLSFFDFFYVRRVFSFLSTFLLFCSSWYSFLFHKSDPEIRQPKCTIASRGADSALPAPRRLILRRTDSGMNSIYVEK